MKNIFSILLLNLILFGCSNSTNTVNTPEPQVNTPEPQVNTPEPQVNTPEPQVNTPEPQVNKFLHFTISDEYYELSKEEIEKDYLIGGTKNDSLEDRKEFQRNLHGLRVFFKNKKTDFLMEDGNFLDESITIFPSPWEPSPEVLTIIKEDFEQVMNSKFTGKTELLDYGTKKYNNVYYIYLISKQYYKISSNKIKYRFSHQYIIKVENNSFLITINTFENIKFDDVFTK
jgi:hypothetical protein